MKKLAFVLISLFVTGAQAEPLAPLFDCVVFKVNGSLPLKDPNYDVVLARHSIDAMVGKSVNGKVEAENIEYSINIGYIQDNAKKPVLKKNDIVIQADLSVDGYEVNGLADTYRPAPGRYGISIYNKKTEVSYRLECFRRQ